MNDTNWKGTYRNGDPVRTPPQQVWRIVEGAGAWWWFWPDTDCFGAKVGTDDHPAYAFARAVR